MNSRNNRQITAQNTRDERDITVRNMRAMQAAELRVEHMRARRALDHGWL